MQWSWVALVGILSGCPGVDEVCNGIDDDGDGQIDEDAIDAAQRYSDGDGDGFGRVEADVGCPTDSLVWQGGDCDDEDDDAFPGADELCNGVDDDCDGVIPDDELDADADGWLACGADCNDDDPEIGPDQAERCNGIDDDCDEVVPDDELDADEDGVRGCEGDCDDTDPTAAPGLPEDCDHVDDDCDGNLDWGLWVPDDFADPAEALLEAPDGSTVCIAEGTYTGPFYSERAVSLVGESRGATVLTSDTVGSNTLHLETAIPTVVRNLTITHAAPTARGRLVDLRGPIDVSAVTLAGPECTGDCLVLVGKVDSPSDEVAWEDVLVRDITWTGATRDVLGPGLQVEGPLVMRRVTYRGIAIEPSACGAYVRGAALFGPRARVEDMVIEGVTVDLPDCTTELPIQVVGGLVMLVPEVDGLTVRDVDVRLLETASPKTVSIRGLIARLPGSDVRRLEVEGVRLEAGGQPTGTGLLLELDGSVDGLRVADVQVAAPPGAVMGGVIATTANQDWSASNVEIDGIEFSGGISGDGMLLGVPPSRGLIEVELDTVSIEGVAADGPLIWFGPGLVDLTVRELTTDDVAGTGIFEVMSVGTVDIEDWTARGATLTGPAYESWSSSTTSDLRFVDLRGNSVANQPLLMSIGPMAGENWVLAANDVTGTANGALVEVRGGRLDLAHATIADNSVEETPESVGATHIRAVGGALSHVDLAYNTGDARRDLVGGLYTAAYTNQFGNSSTDWSVDSTTDDIALEPLYIDAKSGDPADWDLRLDTTSPLIDAGDPTCTDPDGSVCDVGAYGAAAWP